MPNFILVQISPLRWSVAQKELGLAFQDTPKYRIITDAMRHDKACRILEELILLDPADYSEETIDGFLD